MKDKILSKSIFFVLLVCCFFKQAYAQVDPWEMIQRMGRGINIGNTMDAPTEGQWQAPI